MEALLETDQVRSEQVAILRSRLTDFSRWSYARLKGQSKIVLIENEGRNYSQLTRESSC